MIKNHKSWDKPQTKRLQTTKRTGIVLFFSPEDYFSKNVQFIINSPLSFQNFIKVILKPFTVTTIPL